MLPSSTLPPVGWICMIMRTKFRGPVPLSVASRRQLPVTTLCRKDTELVRRVIVDSFRDPSTDADRSWKELETPGIRHHIKCRKCRRRRPLTGPRAGRGGHRTASSLYASNAMRCDMTLQETTSSKRYPLLMPVAWVPTHAASLDARCLCQASSGPLQRQKLPDMDGLAAKLETETDTGYGKPIVPIKASGLRKSLLERAEKGGCGIG
ncbi:uncharacterized protein BKA55DRAFT_306877 [Fusarium redolens]|jgi:hypothetical protein|uniref:Uncharacterized protein n=1 Tax=Fusarium redolens TaxID=48865 RepID=A0A9P9KJW2_FUSRE|nr:uncharacterized protein BKA55DRAFT_306877 [Fusarium redolens]KAH7259781.1 hypothetical protein BKA55DRAFT_306877 [Fusarium redolens]